MGTGTRQMFGGKSGKLAAALDERGVGLRTLARGLEQREARTRTPEERKNRIEAIRRSLNLYVHHGREATDLVRQGIEDELGMARDSLKSDDEDEESQPPLRVTFPVTIDLPQELVDRAVQRHLDGRAAQELEIA